MRLRMRLRQRQRVPLAGSVARGQYLSQNGYGMSITKLAHSKKKISIFFRHPTIVITQEP